jgi:hypothetical protein
MSNYTRVNFVSFEGYDENCRERAENIYLFSQTDTLDFIYDQLGIIEVNAGNYASKGELLDAIKFESWAHCGNAVIYLPDTFLNKKPIYSDNDSITFNENIIPQKITCYAVKVHRDSKFVSKYGNKIDTNFIARGALLKKDVNAAQRSNTIAGIAIGSSALLILFALIAFGLAVYVTVVFLMSPLF